MQLTEHFSLKELTFSQYAEDNGISNLFDATVVDNLLDLCIGFLEPFRLFYGKGIRVSSGFRSEALNKALGGVSTSAHKCGLAADLQPVNDTMENFLQIMEDFLKSNPKLGYDEVIIEKSKTSTWIHVAIRSISGKQRKKHFELKV